MLSVARLEELLKGVKVQTLDEFLVENPELGVGLFGPAELDPALRPLEHAEARAMFELAWERRQLAKALEDAANYTAAIRIVREAGAGPKQLSEISGVARGSIYLWLGEA